MLEEDLGLIILFLFGKFIMFWLVMIEFKLDGIYIFLIDGK